MFGGVRFGGTLTVESAFEHGFRPHRALRRRRQADRDPDLPNGLARGVRRPRTS